MDKKTFCPFINGECQRQCMFHTVSSNTYDDHFSRNCLIATGLDNIPARTEELLDDIVKIIKKNSL